MANVPLARFPAKMDSMAEIRSFVESACATAGIGREDCLKILLIVEELFTNTVTHGYREESESPVWLALEPDNAGFTLRYEDAAPPHNPFGEFRPTDTTVLIAEQPVGGLGLKLIRSLARDTGYTREGERNCIRMTFALRTRGHSPG
ncbi:MAG TPA: ATP-binding protein [Burkholderiales bacterium]|nr:ATP-binding protein [Burkholderiales bacterium]